MNKLPFVKKNYQLMVIGLLVIALGYTIMALDKEQHGFGFMGITLGPIIVIAGFVVQIFAILHKPKEKS
jgi:FtsH-binding integral membrane protein